MIFSTCNPRQNRFCIDISFLVVVFHVSLHHQSNLNGFCCFHCSLHYYYKRKIIIKKTLALKRKMILQRIPNWCIYSSVEQKVMVRENNDCLVRTTNDTLREISLNQEELYDNSVKEKPNTNNIMKSSQEFPHDDRYFSGFKLSSSKII